MTLSKAPTWSGDPPAAAKSCALRSSVDLPDCHFLSNSGRAWVQHASRLVGQLLRECARQLSLPDIMFELERVRLELADSFAQLFNRHRVFIVHPAERLLIEVHLHHGGCLGAFDAEMAGNLTLGLLHLVE